MSRGFVNESSVRILFLCLGCPGRLGPAIGDGCRRDVACELMLTYGGFPSAPDSCKLVAVLVLDMRMEVIGLQDITKRRFRNAAERVYLWLNLLEKLEEERVELMEL